MFLRERVQLQCRWYETSTEKHKSCEISTEELERGSRHAVLLAGRTFHSISSLSACMILSFLCELFCKAALGQCPVFKFAGEIKTEGRFSRAVKTLQRSITSWRIPRSCDPRLVYFILMSWDIAMKAYLRLDLLLRGRDLGSDLLRVVFQLWLHPSLSTWTISCPLPPADIFYTSFFIQTWHYLPFLQLLVLAENLHPFKIYKARNRDTTRLIRAALFWRRFRSVTL